MLVLTKKIIQSTPDGFNSFMITGKRGIGKSTYSLWALHDALVSMGFTDNNAWREALSSLQFSIPEVISYIEGAVEQDIKRTCMIWDDTRIFASGSQYHLQMKMVNKLSGLLDAVRTSLNVLILTCPSPSGLLGVLKTYDDYLIKIHYSERGGFYRLAKGYIWSTLPAGQKRIYLKYRDTYNCRLPNWVYEKYMIRRKKALKDVLMDLKATVNI